MMNQKKGKGGGGGAKLTLEHPQGALAPLKNPEHPQGGAFAPTFFQPCVELKFKFYINLRQEILW